MASHPALPQWGRAPRLEPAWPKWGREAGLGPGALGSSVVKFSKDDPQLVSENAVFLGFLLRAL